MSLNHLEVWNKLPINDLQRQDLLKALIEDHICPLTKLDQNMTKLDQKDEPDLLKLGQTWSNDPKS
jgi:hypothetical protein